MSENSLNIPSSPQSSPSTSSEKSPNLGGSVREGLDFSQAIDVASEQATGSSSGSTATHTTTTTAQTTDTTPPSLETPYGALENLEDTTLIRLTRKLLQRDIQRLAIKAEALKKSTSPTRGAQMQDIIREMRRLHISLLGIYRLAIDKVRELYTQRR